MRIAPAALVLIPAAALFAAAAEAHSDTRRGFALTRHWCAGCHAVVPGRASTNPDAPTFRAIADERSSTAYALRVFLRTPHPSMPNFVLAPADIDEIASYIVSLKSRR